MLNNNDGPSFIMVVYFEINSLDIANSTAFYYLKLRKSF